MLLRSSGASSSSLEVEPRVLGVSLCAEEFTCGGDPPAPAWFGCLVVVKLGTATSLSFVGNCCACAIIEECSML